MFKSAAWFHSVLRLTAQVTEFRSVTSSWTWSGNTTWAVASVIDCRDSAVGPDMGTLAQSHKVHFDSFVVDLRAGEIYKHGIRLKLQDQPFRVFSFLLERPGQVVTREELRQRLWSADTFVDFNTCLLYTSPSPRD